MRSIGGRCRLIEDRRARRLPLRHPLRQQRVELPLPVGQRVQLLPVAAVIRGKLGADGGELRLQLAYIRLQCLHAARQAAALALAVLVGLARRGRSRGRSGWRFGDGGRLDVLALALVSAAAPVAVFAEVGLEPVALYDEQ